MERSLATELLLPLNIEGYRWSAYWVINAVLAGFCSAGLVAAAWRNPLRLGRPAFMAAALTHLIFQWPLAIFSPIFEKSLPGHWFFAGSVHIPVFACLLWVLATKGLTKYAAQGGTHSGQGMQYIPLGGRAILLALFAALTGLYLSRVGWQCTGLYAMLFDPELALLAREMSGKLVRDGLALYGYGVLANVVCPLVVYTALCGIHAAVPARQYGKALAWAMTGIGALLAVLFPGAKGGLIPTVIVVGVGLVTLRGTWLRRAAILVCVFGAGILMLSAIEVLRERQVLARGCYDFGACVSRHHACPEASMLLQSLRYRVMSLGLSDRTMDHIERDLNAACSPEQPNYGSLRCISKRGVPVTAPASKGAGEDKVTAGRTNSYARMAQYAMGILYRLGAVPVQVAGWYHLYVDEHGSPGVYALPLSSILLGRRVIMPIRIHEEYYPTYSGGDRTSTGTAPTSFLLAYPAYLGFAGIVLALAAIIFFDFVSCIILARLGSTLRAAGIGLLAVASVNFMVSDFGTTLLSHGTAAALLLLLLLSFTERKSGVL
jgi:hypothetical protein